MRNLLIALLKSGAGSIGTVIFGIATVKIIAMALGPAGVGLFSLLKQATLTLAFVGFGSQTALVHGVAARDSIERANYIRTTSWLFLGGSVATVLLILAFAPMISELLFGKYDSKTTHLVRWIALPVVLSNAYIYLRSLLNGYRAIGRLAVVENVGPLIQVLLVYPACLWVAKGNALAFVWMLTAAQAAMLATAIALAAKRGWLAPVLALDNPLIEGSAASYFVRFARATLVAALLTTGALLATRAMIARHGGLQAAGLFDLAWALSASYVMVLLGAFGTYLMPVLSGMSDASERLALVRQVIRLSTLVMVPLITSIVTLKPLVVTLLYTAEFLPALELVRWMLIGDYLKVMTWLLGIAVLANASMGVYLAAEFFWNVGFAALAALSLFSFQESQGIGIAFIALHLCVNYYYLTYVRQSYGLRLTGDLLLPWLAGLVVVILASLHTWNSREVDWGTSIFWTLLSLLFVWLVMNKSEKQSLWKACRSMRSNS